MVENAKLNWSMGDQALAKRLVQTIVEERKPCLSLIEADRLYAEYIAETRSEMPSVIIKERLAGSISVMTKYRELIEKKVINIPEAKFNAFEAEHKSLAYSLMAKCK